MTPEQFCYWLQGRAELMPDTPPTCAEWKMIAEHLATVFKKVTPPLQSVSPIAPTLPTIQDWQRAFKAGDITPLQYTVTC